MLKKQHKFPLVDNVEMRLRMGVREVRWYSRQGVILTMFLICTNNTIVGSSPSSRLLLTVLLLSVLRQPVLQTFNFRSLLVDNCLRALKSISHEEDQTLWVAAPSSRGDLDGEVGGREEGKDLGGDVVAAVVHALAE